MQIIEQQRRRGAGAVGGARPSLIASFFEVWLCGHVSTEAVTISGQGCLLLGTVTAGLAGMSMALHVTTAKLSSTDAAGRALREFSHWGFWVGCALVVVGLCAGPWLIAHMAPGASHEVCTGYARWRAAALLPRTMGAVASGFALGRSRHVAWLWANGVGLGVTVVLAPLLVMGFGAWSGLGAVGAGLADFISAWGVVGVHALSGVGRDFMLAPKKHQDAGPARGETLRLTGASGAHHTFPTWGWLAWRACWRDTVVPRPLPTWWSWRSCASGSCPSPPFVSPTSIASRWHASVAMGQR